MRPKKRGWLSGVIGVCVFVTAAVWMVQGVRQTAASSGEEGRLLAEQAVRRASCGGELLRG